MGSEWDGLKKFMGAWAWVIVSVCYCYGIGKMVPKGAKRLILVIPVVYLLSLVPLHISSVHLRGITAFFVAWLSTFKLLLFAFGRGPLSPHPPLSLPLFLAVSCLPISIHPNPPPPPLSPNSQLRRHTAQNPSPRPHPCAKSGQPEAYPGGHDWQNRTRRPTSREGPLNYTIKGLLLVVLVKVYDYSHYMPPKALLALYAFHIYFLLELILAMGATVTRVISGARLVPQFNEPYLATSLQDFWGRRWNLMVTSILRPTVYEPALSLFFPVVGRKWAPLPAVFGTFVVSALMHELMFYYMGQLRPAWKVTWFFLIHGVCVTVEIGAKKAVNGRWRVPRAAARVLTVGFVMVTGLWLFVPEITRCKIDERAFQEYAAIAAFAEQMPQCIRGFLQQS